MVPAKPRLTVPTVSERYRIVGQVVSGRGNAATQIGVHASELKRKVGENLIAGTLNVIFRRPVLFARGNALEFAGGSHFLWPALLNGKAVWLYRWRGASLHIAEVLATVRLRDTMSLHDGDKVVIELKKADVETIPVVGHVVWSLFWVGRLEWSYTNNAYYSHARKWCSRFGATQQDSKNAQELFMGIARALVRRTPAISSLVKRMRRLIAPKKMRGNAPFHFERLPLDSIRDPQHRTFTQIHNLLNYTKTSGSSYSGKQYSAGYHTIELNGQRLQGQRDPAKRLAQIPIDFHGKTVLDIGCNQGGMLLQLEGSVKWGVGIDYDPRMINAANRIKSLREGNSLHFYVFDLDNEPLELIEDLMPEPKADVVFLLAVCFWVQKWREVIEFGAKVSDSMVFETTGTDAQQSEQRKHLESLYQQVLLLAESSEDDPHQRRRKLFFCH